MMTPTRPPQLKRNVRMSLPLATSGLLTQVIDAQAMAGLTGIRNARTVLHINWPAATQTEQLCVHLSPYCVGMPTCLPAVEQRSSEEVGKVHLIC